MCPNGVEWKTFDELGVFYGGLSGKTKDDFKDGNAKFITYLNIACNPALRLDIDETVKIGPNEKQNIVQYGDALFTGSSETPDECAMSSVVTEQPTENLYLNSFCFGFRFNSLDGICPAFYKHYFRCDMFRKAVRRTANGTTRFNVSKKEFSKLEIPIPPLEIQERIVAILDAFSSLAAELQAELQAELHLRRKQYEYYRTQLLTPHSDGNSADNSDDCNWEWKQITDIADTFIGLATSVTKYKRPQGVLLLHNSDIKEGRIELKTVEYLDTDFVQKNGSKILHTDDIITVHTGDVGTSAVITPEYDGTIGFTTISSRIKDKTIITPAFLCKILNSEVCKNAIASKTISARNNLNLASFDELRIPIPPLAEQERIVAILDKFEALTTSLSDGIPAEQAAQQKRYEYYRDKLLTFEKRP
jgi:type I restriction enzyme S subunit